MNVLYEKMLDVGAFPLQVTPQQHPISLYNLGALFRTKRHELTFQIGIKRRFRQPQHVL